MPRTTDMMGRTVTVPDHPTRILSLVPSQTELLCQLGLAERLAGVTKFCIHPADIRKKAGVVGGTKQIRWERLSAISPDLIIGNKEENEREMIERLSSDYPVWMSDVRTLDEALAMIQGIGTITGKRSEADSLAFDIRKSFESLLTPDRAYRPKILYLIWRDPWMGVGADTFIHDMIDRAGFSNGISTMERYPMLTEQTMRDLDPDAVFLSSEPYPFQTRHLDELARILPKAEIRLVDGELFSWYGNRLLLAPAYFANLRHTFG